MEKNTINQIFPVGLLLITAFSIRIFIHRFGLMHNGDVHFFQFWAEMLHRHGLSGFYERGLTDYPPVYLYVLYALGAIRAHFNWPILSCQFNLLTALPAMLSDLAIGCLIYAFAIKKNASIAKALLFTAAWLFNPAVIVNSSMWGQVDSVLVLPLIVSLFFLEGKKLTAAYIAYGIAILVKPQALILGSIYLYSAYGYLKNAHISGKKEQSKANLELVRSIGFAVGVMFFLALPFAYNFNIMPIISRFFSTMGQYNYGSLSAYNFFGLIGGNFRPLDTRFLGLPYLYWGVAFISAIIIFSIIALHADNYGQKAELSKSGRKWVISTAPTMGMNLYLVAGTLFVLFFMFSFKMHERYLYYALPFLLLSFIKINDKRQLWLYIAFSATNFINCLNVLLKFRGHELDILNPIAVLNLAVTGYLIYVVFNRLWPDKIRSDADTKRNAKNPLKSIISRFVPNINETPPKMNAKDRGLFIALMLVITATTFINLGYNAAPQTVWKPTIGESAVVDFGEIVELSEVQFFIGQNPAGAFALYASPDGQSWSMAYFSSREYSVFRWERAGLNNIQAKYVEIMPFGTNGLRLHEIAFRDREGIVVPISHISPEAYALTDEQHLVPDRSSGGFMSSTFFDEVHHARSGYEFVHGLPVHETTHPPLGKVFMAMSINILGMTPFAWRLPGVLAGLLMIPLIYAFARQLLNSNRWALFAAFIFSFDFMRFAQTRIATIDSYVVLFIIAMYFFMYLYIKGIHQRSFSRSLGLLFLCGASMGLAVASKWQGIYGALGLPILFAPVWFNLYKTNKKQAIATAGACFIAFIAVPILIYGLSYIPFVRSSGGTGLLEGLHIIWNNQQLMLWYHSTLEAEHPFTSGWWTWPLMLRPIHYYAGITPDGLRRGISSFGNPALWWLGIVATGFAIYRLVYPIQDKRESLNPAKAVKTVIKRDYVIVFLLTAYAVQFLPWAFVTRIAFIYHYFPGVPFVALLVAWFFKTQLKSPKWAIGYAVIVAGLFALFYPVLSGMPVDLNFVDRFLRWLPGWILV